MFRNGKRKQNRRHGFREKLSDNKLAKFKPNRSGGCRLVVKNVRLTFRNDRSEKKKQIKKKPPSVVNFNVQ